jgi:hypothetical protein
VPGWPSDSLGKWNNSKGERIGLVNLHNLSRPDTETDREREERMEARRKIRARVECVRRGPLQEEPSTT